MAGDPGVLAIGWYRAGRCRATAPLTRSVVGIGRACDNDLVVDAATVSKHHVRLESVDGHWVVRDLGSRNGSRLNGVPIADRTIVTIGDRLMLGDEEVRVTSAAPPSITRPSLNHLRSAVIAGLVILALASVTRSAPDRPLTAAAERQATIRRDGARSKTTSPRVIADADASRRSTALLREAERAYALGSVGLAVAHAKAAVAIAPGSRPEQRLLARFETERLAAVERVRRAAGLAEAANDPGMAVAHLTQLLQLLVPGDPGIAAVKREIAGLSSRLDARTHREGPPS